MENKKKKPRGLFLALAALIGIPAGLYFAVRSYNVSARISMYEETWHIDLPQGIKEEYNVESDHGFQGDGLWYTVYRQEDADAPFLQGTSGRKDQEMEKKIASSLVSMRAEKDRYPDFTHPYVWKRLSENDDFKQLYILYDPQESLAYFLQDII